MTEYWFARRYPLGHARSAMAPVHWKGWMVVAGFVAALTIGGFAFAWFGAGGRMMEGVALFILAAFIGSIWFLSVTRTRSDRVRTVADYRQEQKRV